MKSSSSAFCFVTFTAGKQKQEGGKRRGENREGIGKEWWVERKVHQQLLCSLSTPFLPALVLLLACPPFAAYDTFEVSIQLFVNYAYSVTVQPVQEHIEHLASY